VTGRVRVGTRAQFAVAEVATSQPDDHAGMKAKKIMVDDVAAAPVRWTRASRRTVVRGRERGDEPFGVRHRDRQCRVPRAAETAADLREEVHADTALRVGAEGQSVVDE